MSSILKIKYRLLFSGNHCDRTSDQLYLDVLTLAGLFFFHLYARPVSIYWQLIHPVVKPNCENLLKL